MAWIAPEWLEHQRCSFTRHDAHRFIKPDAGSPRAPGRAGTAADEIAEADLLEQRLALARLRLDWELLKLALRGRKAGFNPDQPRDDHGRWVDTGGRRATSGNGGRDQGRHPLESFAAARRRGRSLAYCTAQYAADGLICRIVAPSLRRACWEQANLRWSNCLSGRQIPPLNF